jgi:catechol 2,3-dioxygenase-like lactoylglutathione lyase family enzyme
MSDDLVSVRHMVDDVEGAIDFYTTNFGFELGRNAAPAFAEVIRGRLRLLLAGPESSAGRPMPDGRKPSPGGWNRIHFVVDDITAEVERLRPRRGALPQRDHHRPRRPTDPARRSLGQPDRAVPTSGAMVRQAPVATDPSATARWRPKRKQG